MSQENVETVRQAAIHFSNRQQVPDTLVAPDVVWDTH